MLYTTWGQRGNARPSFHVTRPQLSRSPIACRDMKQPALLHAPRGFCDWMTRYRLVLFGVIHDSHDTQVQVTYRLHSSWVVLFVNNFSSLGEVGDGISPSPRRFNDPCRATDTRRPSFFSVFFYSVGPGAGVFTAVAVVNNTVLDWVHGC